MNNLPIDQHSIVFLINLLLLLMICELSAIWVLFMVPPVFMFGVITSIFVDGLVGRTEIMVFTIDTASVVLLVFFWFMGIPVVIVFP